MFGSLWDKKKEPTILGGKSNGVPGMPSGLYSSKDVENLRFHDKRRVGYDAKQVDDALDTIQATLEWWESKFGLTPGSETALADAGSDDSVEEGAGSPLGIDVDNLAGRDDADSELVPDEHVQSDVENTVEADPEPSQPAPVAEPVDESAVDTPAEDSEGETTAVIVEGPEGAPASTTDVSPAGAAGPGDHESKGHESEFSAVRAKPTVNPAPTFDLNLIAQYKADDAGEAADGVDEPSSEKPVGELGRVYHEWARLLSAGEKPVEEPAEQDSEAEQASKADSGETAHTAPYIQVPEVPPVPVIPTNPFLRRG